MSELKKYCKNWIIQNLDGGEDWSQSEGSAHYMSSVELHEFVQEMLDNFEEVQQTEVARLTALNAELVDVLGNVLAICDDSVGVDGYHFNGDVAEWGEFEEIAIAEELLNKIKQEQDND